MSEEGRRREVIIATFVYIQGQLNDAVSRLPSADHFLCDPLVDLQKTVFSMQPVVNDIQSSLNLQKTIRFLQLLQHVDALISRFYEIVLPPTSFGMFKAYMCNFLGIEIPASFLSALSYKNDLKSIRESLKNFFKDFVEEELDNLTCSDQEVADLDEVKKLLKFLVRKIRNETSNSSSVFRKIVVILRSLDREEYLHMFRPAAPNRAPLLLVLKQVQLLVKSLNGDHDLDIPTLLLPLESDLREFLTDDVVKSQLKELDKQDEKLQREKLITNQFIILVLLPIIMWVCIPDMPTGDKAYLHDLCIIVRSSMTILFVLLAGILVKKIYSGMRLGMSDTNGGQSSNSNNPCCRVFGLLSFVAVVGVVVVAIAIAVTDEPKKYDIFLNFRGSQDIRFTVAGVFHRSLEKANFTTFFDERSARKTKRFLKEIESAISTSVGAITIFTEYYGDSEYCLDELLLILEREKTDNGYIIRPIFYDVEPDDFKNPDSKFGQGLQKHYKTQRKDKVEEWKEALDTVTLIGGDVHKSDRHHLDDLVDRVVEDFKNQLGNKRGAENNTIQRWRSFIMKMVSPINLRIGNVKLSVDLWCFKFDVTMIPAS